MNRQTKPDSPGRVARWREHRSDSTALRPSTQRPLRSARFHRYAVPALAAVITGIIFGRGFIGIGAIQGVGGEVSTVAGLSVLPFVAAISIGVNLIATRKSPHNRVELFAAFFLARTTLALVFTSISQVQDELGLHAAANSFVCCPVITWQSMIRLGQGYVALNGELYRLFGSNIFIPKITNVLLGSILPFLVYDICNALFQDEKTAMRGLLFAGWAPPLLTYSAYALKELPTAFLIVLSLWCLLVPKRTVWSRVAGAFATTVVLYLLRGVWAVFPLLAVAVYLLAGSGERISLKQAISLRTVAIIGGLLVLVAFPLHPLIQAIPEKFQERLLIGAYSSLSSFQKAHSSVTRSFLDLSHPFSLHNIIVQTLRAPFIPSPLAAFLQPSISATIDSINAASNYVLLPLAMMGAAVGRAKSGVVAISAVLAGIIFTMGLGLVFDLTVERQGIAMAGVLCILAARGVGRHREYRPLLHSWAAGASVFTLLYLHYKY